MINTETNNGVNGESALSFEIESSEEISSLMQLVQKGPVEKLTQRDSCSSWI